MSGGGGGPSLSHSEFPIYLDSANRNTEEFKEPNDIDLPVATSQADLPVYNIHLGSMELPMSQYTIEQDWSRLYFDEGVLIDVGPQANGPIESRQFRVTDGTDEFRVDVPVFLNPITKINGVSLHEPGSPCRIGPSKGPFTFTTKIPHGLCYFRFWNEKDPIRLISTDIPPPFNTFTKKTIPSFTIINERTFRIEELKEEVTFYNYSDPRSGPFLHAPVIPDPAVLAGLLTGALGDLSGNPGFYQVTYDQTTSRYSFGTPSQPCPGTGIITKTSSFSLPVRMGLVVDCYCQKRNDNEVVACLPGTKGETSLCNSFIGEKCFEQGKPFGQTLDSRFLPVQSVYRQDVKFKGEVYLGAACKGFANRSKVSKLPPPYTIVGGFGNQCVSVLQITPCNYDPSSMMSELDLEWNRFFFTFPCELSPEFQPKFTFSDAGGQCFHVMIPFGNWGPTGFARFLQCRMNELDPCKNYQVDWVVQSCCQVEEGIFIFSADEVFSLEFLSPSENSLPPSLLGFQKHSYNGGTRYQSDKSIFVPVEVCALQTALECKPGAVNPDSKQLKNLYHVNVDACAKKFSFHALNRPGRPAMITKFQNGVATFHVDPILLTHGVQVGDVILMTEKDTGVEFDPMDLMGAMMGVVNKGDTMKQKNKKHPPCKIWTRELVVIKVVNYFEFLAAWGSQEPPSRDLLALGEMLYEQGKHALKMMVESRGQFMRGGGPGKKGGGGVPPHMMFPPPPPGFPKLGAGPPRGKKAAAPLLPPPGHPTVPAEAESGLLVSESPSLETEQEKETPTPQPGPAAVPSLPPLPNMGQKRTVKKAGGVPPFLPLPPFDAEENRMAVGGNDVKQEMGEEMIRGRTWPPPDFPDIIKDPHCEERDYTPLDPDLKEYTGRHPGMSFSSHKPDISFPGGGPHPAPPPPPPHLRPPLVPPPNVMHTTHGETEHGHAKRKSLKMIEIAIQQSRVIVPFNLYFGETCDQCIKVDPINPSILGATKRDNLWTERNLDQCGCWNGSNLKYCAPNVFKLGHPDYLLVIISEPFHDTANQHEWRGELQVQVFAKIIMYPNYQTQRLYPQQANFQTTNQIRKIHITFLNPDHTLYHFHGADWSGTLVAVVP